MSRRRLLGCLGTVLLVPLLAVVVGLAWWLRRPADLDGWQGPGPPPTEWASLRRQLAAWRAEGYHRDVEHEFVPLAQISVELPLAVLIGEDVHFLDHRGIDPLAIRDALLEWREGQRLRGASTITQQLARTLFLSRERTLWRKVEEARLAHWCERSLGKQRILELYLNTIEFGPGVFGAQAGARHYFGTDANDLDAEQAAALAAAIPAPGRDNPATRSPRWEARRKVLLERTARATTLRARLAPLCSPARPGV